MAAVMSGLLDSRGVQFTARAALRTRENIAPRCLSRSSRTSSIASSGKLAGEGGEVVVASAQPNMSIIEVEACLREKVRSSFDSLKQAFQMYDVDGNETVTKGEFRRVLETYCMPLTTDQFQAIVTKVDSTSGGSIIKYVDFLTKFHGGDTAAKMRSVRSGPPAPREVNMDMIEKLLRDRINGNFRAVVRGLQLFDYNMDGKVQRHELRRVLENFCFKFTDQQFEKLWLRYDFHHTGLVNYRDFLKRLGVNVKNSLGPSPGNTAAGALKWPSVTSGPFSVGKVASNRLRNQQRDDEKLMKSLTFDQIEIEFRNRMRKNYLKLKKAFMTFDIHLDGYVSIDDLKNILNSFTLPMSDQLFVHLMERCGVKASGRVSWEIFLEKFQNPITVGNGQSLPIRPNHRIHPIMETQSVVDWDTMWNQLYKRVQSHYHSLKEAFLQMDKNRDGRVTKKEFRELIEKFTFHLDDKQFKELMSRVDPDHNTQVDYHTFLRMFEEKETKEGHKWLRSVHKFNDKPKPAVVAWETVEDILREKITYYWKNVSDWLTYYDRKGLGYLSKGTLKKVIDLQVLPISDDHFESLISRCSDFHEGKVNYMEFLDRLGVDVSPGDVVGLSTQIMAGSGHAEMMRQVDLVNRNNQMAMSQCYRTSEMSADEVILRFKDKMTQLSPALRKAFLKYDKKNKGRITKLQFREILSELGILMSDEQFSELMAKLNLKNGHMNYMDFIMNFGDPRHSESPGVVPHQDNHRVNAIRGDENNMTALEVEAKLEMKMRENFANLRGAFYKFDDLHRGYLNKINFRHMLDSFMLKMTDAEYDILCARLGIVKGSPINYIQFLDRFEQRDGPEGHKWLNSMHRYNDTFPSKPVTAEEAHNILGLKAYRQWKDLSKAFRTMDSKGNGIITKKELRDQLKNFMIPITAEEFKKLWARLDVDGKGFISHQDFLQRLGAAEYAPGDDEGLSSNIISGNYRFLEDHNRLQQERHEDITWNQANLTYNMPAIMVERQLRDKIRDNYQDFYSAFRKYDTRKIGSLSPDDVQKVLVEQNFFINDEQFFALLDRIGLPTDKSSISYSEFLAAFEDGRKSSYGRQPQDIRIEEFRKLKPQEAELKLKDKLEACIDDVTKALTAFDRDGSGKVPVAEFRRVLDMFCFILTEPQWKHIKSGLNIGPDECVKYNEFLSTFGSGEIDISNQYLQSLQNAFPPGPHPVDAIDEVAERIHEATLAHYHNILRDFERIDYASIGSVTAEDLRDVLARHIMRLNDEQFEKLWGIVPVNSYGNVEYKQMLKMFSEDMSALLGAGSSQPSSNIQAGPNKSGLPERPSTSMSQRPLSRASNRPLSRMSYASSRSRAPTPMVNAESAERQVKDVVFRYWREIQKKCRDMDVDKSSTISVKQFGDILSLYGCLLPPPDFNDLVTKYDINENGRFHYSDFVRHFLLTVKPGEAKALTNREKMPVKKLHHPNMSIPEVDEKDDALRRTNDCVGQNWKEMRREFRNKDMECRGCVSADEFRRVLRQFNINLSENEFQHLQDRYDKNFTDWVNYNDFLKDHLN